MFHLGEHFRTKVWSVDQRNENGQREGEASNASIHKSEFLRRNLSNRFQISSLEGERSNKRPSSGSNPLPVEGNSKISPTPSIDRKVNQSETLRYAQSDWWFCVQNEEMSRPNRRQRPVHVGGWIRLLLHLLQSQRRELVIICIREGCRWFAF